MDYLNLHRKSFRAAKNTKTVHSQSPALVPKDHESEHYKKTFRNDSRTRAGRLYTKGILYFGEYKSKYGYSSGMLTKDEFLKYYLWSHGIEEKDLETHFNCSKEAMKIAIKRATEKINKYEWNIRYFEHLKTIKSFDEKGLVKPYGI